MCDERERLIEYLYAETDVEDRKRIDAHLAECHECRAEVAGLRAVRDDLLAWHVPRHEAIWRPFVPEPAAPVRRSWPTWALATAASAVFAAGLAGGMAARGWTTPPSTESASVAAAAQPLAAPAIQTLSTSSVTPDDLARLEAAILTRVRAEVAEQLRTARPASDAPAVTRVSAGDPSRTEARLAVIEEWMDDQIRLNNIFNSKFGSLSSRTSSLSEQIALQNISLSGSAR